MSRTRAIEFRQVNIAMHKPHSPEGYVDLFQKAFHQGYVHRRGKSDGYMLGQIENVATAVETDELRGEFYSFTSIDLDADWFNTQTREPAKDKETELIAIPEYLLPNLDRFPFIFRPKSHQLWYLSRDRKARMGPGIAEAFLQYLFDATCRTHRLPTVEVTVVPSAAALDAVLGFARMTQLTMVFKRANDDNGDVEQRMKEKMERRNISRMVQTLVSNDPQGIVADEELTSEVRAAAHNGYVESIGYDSLGNRDSESTKEKPALHLHQLDEDNETIMQVLGRFGGA